MEPLRRHPLAFLAALTVAALLAMAALAPSVSEPHGGRVALIRTADHGKPECKAGKAGVKPRHAERRADPRDY